MGLTGLLLGTLAGAVEAAQIFVSPAVAKALVQNGAVVLDARNLGTFGFARFRRGHLQGAQRIDWMDYRDGWGRTGRLATDLPSLRRRLAGLGVRVDRPVLVYGDGPGGYGEEGRIAWMLHYLGHPEVHILDGGYGAYQKLGLPLETGGPKSPGPGAFPEPKPESLGAPVERHRVHKAQVKVARERGELVLDVRTQEEYFGATPYYEARGGHIPGARHLFFGELFDGQGRVLPKQEVQAKLKARGYKQGQGVILYCTGGVRSAMAWAVLLQSGVSEARNYDGSFWEWSADKSLPVTVPGKHLPF